MRFQYCMKFVSLHVDSLSHVRSECCIARYISRSIDFFLLATLLGVREVLHTCRHLYFLIHFYFHRWYKEEVEILELLLTYSHFKLTFIASSLLEIVRIFRETFWKLPVALRKFACFPAFFFSFYHPSWFMLALMLFIYLILNGFLLNFMLFYN